MSRNIGTIILGSVLGVLTLVSVWASSAGWGVPQPAKSPLSIREDSARGTRYSSGHYRTHFFVGGGGVHYGK